MPDVYAVVLLWFLAQECLGCGLPPILLCRQLTWRNVSTTFNDHAKLTKKWIVILLCNVVTFVSNLHVLMSLLTAAGGDRGFMGEQCDQVFA